MELICYHLLDTRSKRAIKRKHKKWGHIYRYEPRDPLITRLAKELGWSKESVRRQLYRERAYLLELKREYSNL